MLTLNLLNTIKIIYDWDKDFVFDAKVIGKLIGSLNQILLSIEQERQRIEVLKEQINNVSIEELAKELVTYSDDIIRNIILASGMTKNVFKITDIIDKDLHWLNNLKNVFFIPDEKYFKEKVMPDLRKCLDYFFIRAVQRKGNIDSIQLYLDMGCDPLLELDDYGHALNVAINSPFSFAKKEVFNRLLNHIARQPLYRSPYETEMAFSIKKAFYENKETQIPLETLLSLTHEDIANYLADIYGDFFNTSYWSDQQTKTDLTKKFKSYTVDAPRNGEDHRGFSYKGISDEEFLKNRLETLKQDAPEEAVNYLANYGHQGGWGFPFVQAVYLILTEHLKWQPTIKNNIQRKKAIENGLEVQQYAEISKFALLDANGNIQLDEVGNEKIINSNSPFLVLLAHYQIIVRNHGVKFTLTQGHVYKTDNTPNELATKLAQMQTIIAEKSISYLITNNETVFRFFDANQVNDKVLKEAAQAYPGIEKIALWSLEKISANTLLSLNKLFPNLTELTLANHHQLVNFSEMNGKSLTFNSLNKLKIIGCYQLNSVTIKAEKLNQLILSDLPKLDLANCEFNMPKLKSLTITTQLDLTTTDILQFVNNYPIKELNLLLWNQLESLGDNKQPFILNKITNLSLAGCVNLKTINLIALELTSLDLTNCSNLDFDTINLCCPNLQEIYLDQNQQLENKHILSFIMQHPYLDKISYDGICQKSNAALQALNQYKYISDWKNKYCFIVLNECDIEAAINLLLANALAQSYFKKVIDPSFKTILDQLIQQNAKHVKTISLSLNYKNWYEQVLFLYENRLAENPVATMMFNNLHKAGFSAFKTLAVFRSYFPNLEQIYIQGIYMGHISNVVEGNDIFGHTARLLILGKNYEYKEISNTTIYRHSMGYNLDLYQSSLTKLSLINCKLASHRIYSLIKWLRNTTSLRELNFGLLDSLMQQEQHSDAKLVYLHRNKKMYEISQTQSSALTISFLFDINELTQNKSWPQLSLYYYAPIFNLLTKLAHKFTHLNFIYNPKYNANLLSFYQTHNLNQIAVLETFDLILNSSRNGSNIEELEFSGYLDDLSAQYIALAYGFINKNNLKNNLKSLTFYDYSLTYEGCKALVIFMSPQPTLALNVKQSRATSKIEECLNYETPINNQIPMSINLTCEEDSNKKEIDIIREGLIRLKSEARLRISLSNTNPVSSFRNKTLPEPLELKHLKTRYLDSSISYALSQTLNPPPKNLENPSAKPEDSELKNNCSFKR